MNKVKAQILDSYRGATASTLGFTQGDIVRIKFMGLDIMPSYKMWSRIEAPSLHNPSDCLAIVTEVEESGQAIAIKLVNYSEEKLSLIGPIELQSLDRYILITV